MFVKSGSCIFEPGELNGGRGWGEEGMLRWFLGGSGGLAG